MSNKEAEQYIDGLTATLKALQRQNEEIDKLLKKIDKLIDLQQKIEEEETRRGLGYGLAKAASWIAYAFTLYRLVVFIMIQGDIQLPDFLVSFLHNLEECLYVHTPH